MISDIRKEDRVLLEPNKKKLFIFAKQVDTLYLYLPKVYFRISSSYTLFQKKNSA